MTTLADFKAKNPAYANVPDDKLADGIYNKFYAGKMDRQTFNSRIGYTPGGDAPELGPTWGETGKDVAIQSGVGLARGTAYLAGASGDIQAAGKGALSFLAEKALGGKDQDHPDQLKPLNYDDPTTAAPVPSTPPQDVGLPMTPLTMNAPTSPQLIGGMEKITGKMPEPKTALGAGTRSIMEFVPAALGGPGSFGRKMVGYAMMPGALKQAGGWLGGMTGLPYGKEVGETVGAVSGLGVGALRTPQRLRGAENTLSGVLTAEQAARLKELGPEAMLVDAGPSMEGVAGGIATGRPSSAKDIMVDALRSRDVSKQARLKIDTNQSLGQSVIPALEDEMMQGQQRQLGELYPQIKGQGISVDVNPVIQNIDKQIEVAAYGGDPQKALKRVREMLAPPEKVTNKGWTPRTVPINDAQRTHNVRIAIDKMIERQPEMASVLTPIRKQLNEQLSVVPGMRANDAAYADIAGQREALKEGSTVLNTGKTATHPYELFERVGGMSTGQKKRLVQGVRADIDRIFGTNANDVAKAKQIIMEEGDWNRAKLDQLFGADNSRKFYAAVEREVTFQNTTRRTIENSMTAEKKAGQEAVGEMTGEAVKPIWTVGGEALTRGMNKIVDTLLQRYLKGRDVDLASKMTLTGEARDKLVEELLKRRASQSYRFPALPMSMSPAGLLRGPDQQ